MLTVNRQWLFKPENSICKTIKDLRALAITAYGMLRAK